MVKKKKGHFQKALVISAHKHHLHTSTGRWSAQEKRRSEKQRRILPVYTNAQAAFFKDMAQLLDVDTVYSKCVLRW